MKAVAGYGETPGGLQTPHATKIRDEYIMVYGDWENICVARSRDGKTFERQLIQAGKSALFTEGIGCGTRDPMITLFDDTYYLYYTSSPGDRGAIYCRTSEDLVNWSKSTEATWIINDNGQYYIASLLPSYQGTRIARLKWDY